MAEAIYPEPDARGMEKADVHLETSLQELNDRVNTLEDGGDREELLEAYVNRGNVLAMMEYRTSALDDLESASDLAEELASEGSPIDAGTFVKIHVTMGSLIFDQDGDPVEEFCIAGTRLKELDAGSRHFDTRSVVRMCISVCENLIDSEHPEECAPFISKGLEVLSGGDAWSDNRRMDLHSLFAEAADSMGDLDQCVSEYAEAIRIGTDLMERGSLENPDDLVMAFVMKANSESDLGNFDGCIADLTAAISILEGMMENHMLSDREVLVTLHHDLAGALMKTGRIEEAEKHLIRAMEIGVVGYAGSVDINVHGSKE